MKLVMSIVNNDDERRLAEALMVAGYRATTISTTGGFLRQGNATIFVGTEDENVPHVLQLIRENCHTRSQIVNPMPPVMEPGEMYMPVPTEVQKQVAHGSLQPRPSSVVASYLFTHQGSLNSGLSIPTWQLTQRSMRLRSSPVVNCWPRRPLAWNSASFLTRPMR